MEDRLNLLCEAGVIDRDICDGMKVVVTQLETRWAIPLQNDQGAMAITHMANALMRSRRGSGEPTGRRAAGGDQNRQRLW